MFLTCRIDPFNSFVPELQAPAGFAAAMRREARACLIHADRVLIGEVDKVRTLIGSLRLSIVNVATGQSVFGRVLGFRGDTDEAWQRAVRFFVRDLETTAAQQR